MSAAIGAAAFAAPAAANATDFVVTTNGDPASHTPCDTTTNECVTLRDALTDANGNGTDDTITFASSLSGQTITLSHGSLPINASDGALAITGLGASNLTIDGDTDSRIFEVSGNGHPTSISALTLTNGYDYGGYGGAIVAYSGTDLTIADSVFTNNKVTGDGSGYSGGAIGSYGNLAVTGSAFTGNQAPNGQGGAIFTQRGMTLRNSTLSGNSAGDGGAIAVEKYNGLRNNNARLTPAKARAFAQSHSAAEVRAAAAKLTSNDFYRSTTEITDSTISGNAASSTGGGIYSPALLRMSGTSVTGNTAAATGGGIESAGWYAQSVINNSTISNNTADAGGGMHVFQWYRPEDGAVKHAVQSSISGSNVTGNTATYEGGGIDVAYLGAGDQFTVDHSTLSGNTAGSDHSTGVGGGILFSQKYAGSVLFDGGSPIAGTFRAVDSTISGNTADTGAGVSVGGRGRSTETASIAERARGPVVADEGSIGFENSTIASNNAKANGGGAYLTSYDPNPYDDNPDAVSSPTVSLTSSILADNNAGGAANDADRADGSGGGGLDTSFSLVEAPGDSPVTQSPGGSSIIGVDPQLGGLTNNGGPTLTQLPAGTSPVVDKGKAPARLLTDQRGHVRTVDGSGVSNAPGGDGTDMGAVEVDSPLAQVANAPAPPADRTPPRITLKVPKTLSIAQLIAGFNVKVNCNEICAMTFRLYGSAPTGTLHSSGYNFRLLNKKIGRKAGSRRVHLRPCVAGSSSSKRTHVCRKRITAALFAKPQKTFKVKLIVAAKDKAGNISHVKRFIRIHR